MFAGTAQALVQWISTGLAVEAQLPQETLLAKASEHHQRGVQAGRLERALLAQRKI